MIVAATSVPYVAVPHEPYPSASVLPEHLYADLLASHCTVAAAYKYM